MSVIRFLLSLFSCCLLGAAAGAPAGSPTAAHSQKAPTKQARMSDAELEKTIRARFARSKINANHFQVHVQGGTATLEGKTDVVQHKGTATRMAKSAGALAVNNKIQVSDAAKEKSANNLEEGRRRAQIKRGDPRSAQ